MGRLTYSASGAVASFKAVGHVPVRHAKFNFTPVQDLHGQSAPYPAGGGKNKFDSSLFDTNVGINVTYVSYEIANGTYTMSSPDFPLVNDVANVFVLAGEVTSGGSSSANGVSSSTSRTITVTDGHYTVAYRSTSANSNNPKNFSWQLEEGSSATTYVPYSNVCPISGWTGLTGYKDSKHGGMIQWNQLVQNGNFADGYTPWVIAANWKTKEVSNGVLHLVSTANQPSYANLLQECGNTIGHVYLCSIWVKSSKATRLEAAVGTTIGGGVFSWQNGTYTADTWTLFSGVSKPTSDSNANFYIRPKNTDNEEEVDVYLKNICLFDLTQMFGSTIADYVYSLETSTAGAGVAWFRAIFPLDYYAYNAGTQTTVDAVNGKTDTQYHVTFPAMGKNLFNGQWEQGDIVIGFPRPSTTAMRSGYINVEPSTSYYAYTTRSLNVFVFEYTEDGTYANKSNNIGSIPVFTTGSTTKKIRIVDRNSGTETVDTGINYPSTETTYEPYTNTVYGGYVDLVTGEVIATHKFLDLADVPDGSWVRSSSYPGGYYASCGSLGLKAYTPFICSQAKTVTQLGSYYYGTCFCDSSICVRIMSSDSTAQDWINYLDTQHANGTPVTICAKLSTPALVTTLTPTELQTFIGENHIWSDANDNTVVEYDAHEATEVFLARKRLIEENSPVERTATGTAASFTTRSNLPLTECKCEFTPVQSGSGDPAPDNVRPISGWTGANVTRAGKNLLDPTSLSEDETYSKRWHSTDGGYLLKANTAYTFSAYAAEAVTMYFYQYGTTTVLASGSRSVTYTPTTDTLVFLRAYKSGDIPAGTNFQLELGQTATTYTPYTGNTYPVQFPATINQWDEQIESGSINSQTGQPSWDNTMMRSANYIPVQPSTTYFIASPYTLGIARYTRDKTFISLNQGIANSTYTTPSDCYYIKFYTIPSYGTTYNHDISINYPSTAKTYEPYGTIYGGYVDLVTGVLTANHICKNAKNLIWTGTGSNMVCTRQSDGYTEVTTDTPNGKTPIYCNIAKYNVNMDGRQDISLGWGGNQNNGNIVVKIDSIITSIEAWREYIAENDVFICYRLATPITYQLTPQQIRSLIGQNNVFSDMNGNTTVKYWKL